MSLARRQIVTAHHLYYTLNESVIRNRDALLPEMIDNGVFNPLIDRPRWRRRPRPSRRRWLFGADQRPCDGVPFWSLSGHDPSEFVTQLCCGGFLLGADALSGRLHSFRGHRPYRVPHISGYLRQALTTRALPFRRIPIAGSLPFRRRRAADDARRRTVHRLFVPDGVNQRIRPCITKDGPQLVLVSGHQYRIQQPVAGPRWAAVGFFEVFEITTNTDVEMIHPFRRPASSEKWDIFTVNVVRQNALTQLLRFKQFGRSLPRLTCG